MLLNLEVGKWKIYIEFLKIETPIKLSIPLGNIKNK
jgi:hypothetical protein